MITIENKINKIETFLPHSDKMIYERLANNKNKQPIVLVTFSAQSIFTIQLIEEAIQDDASTQISNLNKKIDDIESIYDEKTTEEQAILWNTIVTAEKERDILIEEKKKHVLLKPIEELFEVKTKREECDYENKIYSRFSIELNFQQMCELLDVSEEEAIKMSCFKQYFEHQNLKKEEEEINNLLLTALQNTEEQDKLSFSYDTTSVYLTLTEPWKNQSDMPEHLNQLLNYFRTVDNDSLEIESTIQNQRGNKLFDSNEKLVTYSLKINPYKLPLDIGIEIEEKQKNSALKNLKKGRVHDEGVQMVAIRSLYLDKNGSLDVIDSRCNPEKVLREQLQEITYDGLTLEKNGRQSTYNGRALDSIFYKSVELYETTTDNYHNFFKFLNISKNYKNGSSLINHEFNEHYFKEMEDKGICLLFDKEHYYNSIPTIKKDTTKLLNENLDQSNDLFIPEIFFEMPVAALIYQLALHKKTTLLHNKEELEKIDNILPELKQKSDESIEKLNGQTLSKDQWKNITDKAEKSYQLVNEKKPSTTTINCSN